MKSFLTLVFLFSTISIHASENEVQSRRMIKFIGKLAYYKWAGNEMAYATADGKVGKVFVNCKAGLKNPFKIYFQIGEKSVESLSEQKCLADLRKIGGANLNSPVTVYMDNFQIE